ncbi:MAG: hypothetical protein J5757_01740 [Lachnospiraceae bacterium]|nr:hypothetical protein [Lachnospiraceae bacterium]
MKICKEVLKPAIFLAMAILVLCTSVSAVYADFGFKVKRVIKVKNAPNEYYYAFMEYHRSGNQIQGWDAPIDDSELHLDQVDEQSVKAFLRDLCIDNWYGDEYSCKHSNEKNEITYVNGKYEMGGFRLIFIEMDGEVHISPVFQRNLSHVYDYRTGEVTKTQKSGFLHYVLTCLFMTFFLEFLVFGFFGFAVCKKNTSAFLFINIVTNVPFTILYYCLATIFPGASSLVFFVVLELLITFVEAYFYSRVLVDKTNKHCPKRAFICGLVANIISAVCGVIYSIVSFLQFVLG